MKTMTSNEMKALLESKGLAVHTLKWTHSYRGGATFIACPKADFGDAIPTEEHGITVRPFPSTTFDGTGYDGRGRRGEWFAVTLAEESDEDAVFLTADDGWEGVEGAKTLCSDRDSTWSLVPCRLAQEAPEEAWNSLAGLFE